MMDWWGWGWGWMWLMPLLWIGLIALIIWAVVRLVQPSDGRGTRQDAVPPTAETPLQILDRRLASGEIDLDAYTRIREQLTAERPSRP